MLQGRVVANTGAGRGIGREIALLAAREGALVETAPLAVFLASDQATDVTGQIFGVRKNEIFLFAPPRPVRSVHRGDGWTSETITQELLPAFRPSFFPLSRSSDVFARDPI